MGPQQPPEYAGGPKMYHFWGGVKKLFGLTQKRAPKNGFLLTKIDRTS